MWLKWTKRILFGLLITIVVLFIALVSVVAIYEEEIKQYAVTQLNAHLKVKVKAPKIELTIWDQFPSTSLHFSDVLVPDYTSENHKDTMLYAQNIYLNFSFWDILAGNYEVKDIAISNAIINIKTNEKGEDNFDIWKTDTTAVSDGKFSFNINQLKGDDIQLNYVHQPAKQNYDLDIKSIEFAGNFNEINYDLNIKSEMKIKRFHSDGLTLLKNKSSTIDAQIKIDNSSGKYNVKKALLTVEKIKFEIGGHYLSQAKNSSLDLKIKGSNIELASVFSVFPINYLDFIQQYKATGKVQFDAHVVGNLEEKNGLKVSSSFGMENGSIKEKSSGITLKNISFEGWLDNKNKNDLSELKLEKISANLEMGTIKGDFSLENFNAPKIVCNSHGNLSLQKLHQFINSSSISKLSGDLNYDIFFNGQIKEDEFLLTDAGGSIDFKEGLIALPTTSVQYTNLSGSMTLIKNDALVKNVIGKAQESDFQLDGVVRNLLPYIFKPGEQLTIEADLRSNHIALDNLLGSETSSNVISPSSAETIPFELPLFLNLNLKAQIKKLTYGKFIAENIVGFVTLEKQHLNAKSVSFNANKGSYLCNVELEQLKDFQSLFTVNLKASAIDIQNVFTQLDNFGQTYLTDKHIKGKGDMSISFMSILDKDLNVVPSSIVSQADIAILNGSLTNQSTLMEVAVYLDETPLVKKVVDTKMLKEKMNYVSFASLSNTIVIKESFITIPKMQINTNIMDLSIGGTHTFDDKIDYHFSFILRDILVKKSEEEFGPVIDDGLGKKIFLRMYGDLENPKYELDKYERKTEMKQNILEEKQNMKSLLKQEFGLFKKDSTLKNYTPKEKPKPTFEVEWEEESLPNLIDPNKSGTHPPKDKQKEKDGGLNKFMKKLGADSSAKKTTVEMEIDQ